MTDRYTPASERHQLLPDEREAFAKAAECGQIPCGWLPLAGTDPALWVGHGLTLARKSVSGGIELIEGQDARVLLIAHAFRASPEQRRRLGGIGPPGISISEAIAAIVAEFPDYRPVDVAATGALFIRVPEALLACDGKYGQLDYAFFYEGERAIDIVFQYGLSRPLG